jgi:two-component system, sensor histidine kinase and response regulator
VERDLNWKSLRGAAELSHTLELGLALEDRAIIERDSLAYLKDDDVRALIVRSAEGKEIFSYWRVSNAQAHAENLEDAATRLFAGDPNRVRQDEGTTSTWARVEIEGAEIGKIALQIGKDRLKAGGELRQRILAGVFIGCVGGIVTALFFVSFYVGPLIEVVERAFRDLEQRTNEALESARLKSEFLANMSHEIRTPMNGVIGMAELLGKTELTKKQRRYARTISTSATALLTIINDILDFSKIDAGKLAVRPVETDVKRLSEEVAQLMAPQAQAKGLELICSASPRLPEEVLIDGDRLRQVLTNILGNAVKFTQHGSVLLRVDVSTCTAKSCALDFTVQDTGIGIAAHDLDKVFEHFRQADGSLTRVAGGTGLGLSISRHLVELMGGSIELSSELGKGSIFRFRVPCPIVSAQVSSPSGKFPRTLIVDDNVVNRTLLEELFAVWGVPSDSARSGNEALQMLEAAEQRGERFELALVDHSMEGMDGPELALAIRQRFGVSPPRLVLLSSLSQNEVPGELFDDGLAKPVMHDDLRRVIQGRETPHKAEANEPGSLVKFIGRPRLLVVEDNPINREVMREILEELDLDADIVENGKLALDALDQHNYPLVLMDCQMPVMDGYEAACRIRLRTDASAKVPIIAVTAHAVQGEREKALASGMTDYITKPITILRLVRVMARYLPTESTAGSAGNAEATPNPADAVPSQEIEVQIGTSASGEAPSHRTLMSGIRRSKAVVALFIKMVPDQIAGLREAIDTGDSLEVKRSAHKLRGGCAAIGASKMAEICGILEPYPDTARQLIRELELEYLAVVATLMEEEKQAVAQQNSPRLS